MKHWLLAVALVCLCTTARAVPYYQHPSLSLSGIQGELITGPMLTNAGIANLSYAPVFYHNAGVNSNWTDISHSLIGVGWNAANNDAAGDIGSLVDIGPQVEKGIVAGVSLFNLSAGASVLKFFTCSGSTGVCDTMTVGALLNLQVVKNGNLVNNSHDLFEHPLGVVFTPVGLRFGAPGTLSAPVVP